MLKMTWRTPNSSFSGTGSLELRRIPSISLVILKYETDKVETSMNSKSRPVR